MKTRLLSALLLLSLLASFITPTLAQTVAPHAPTDATTLILPLVLKQTGNTVQPADWPQLGRDPQHTNASPQSVAPPFCYTWKWYAVPMASRAQPVVANGRLYIGGMDGVLYARSAGSGAPLWSYATGGPIRHSAAVANGLVLTGSHDGYTYALDALTGVRAWRVFTGRSATAPLVDAARQVVYVAATDGNLTALRLGDGGLIWQFAAGAPILTSPALSADGASVYLGNEAVQAIAVNAITGAERWRTQLAGQSLGERYPLVTGSRVLYRAQPLYFFHRLLHQGDDVLNQAGALQATWSADWSAVRPHILAYLTAQPDKQTFFVLDAASGQPAGVAPLLYTYGNNDPAAMPVQSAAGLFVVYRPRRGIQNESGTVHVSTQYDAELGKMDLASLDIAPVVSDGNLGYPLEFRLTSDEPAMLTMGGDWLWVDNWERLGGVNVTTGELAHVGGVSNVWPECGSPGEPSAAASPDQTECGPGTDNPFFPMSGAGEPYPFPSPRVTEGHSRGGVVVANNMLYWRVIEGGLAGLSHQSGAACPAPLVYSDSAGGGLDVTPMGSPTAEPLPLAVSVTPAAMRPLARPLAEYLTLDLTTPVANPHPDLVARLNAEVTALLDLADGDHLLPIYIERGFTTSYIWPYNTPPDKTGIPSITYGADGNAYWHDPGELLLSLAQAYPYLAGSLQTRVAAFLADEWARYSPLSDLPWGDPGRDWLRAGAAREYYAVLFRDELNNWPPPAANLSALYAVWLWSKNSGDWSYAQAHWNQIKSFFANRQSVRYYADIAGLIGYYRLAVHFNDSAAQTQAEQAALAALQAGLDFAAFAAAAEADYPDPRLPDPPSGWYAPVFYGLTPEIGLYLGEQLNGAAEAYLLSKETGDGLRWWYLTRAGAHAEVGETSFMAPIAGWSHYLAHAYVAGAVQPDLLAWLDRPYTTGDVYSLQKIVAAIQSGG